MGLRAGCEWMGGEAWWLARRRPGACGAAREPAQSGAAIWSMARKRASMLSVWLSAISFAALSLASTSSHHLTVFSASAKSWSVDSSVLMPRKTVRACCLKASRLLAVTLPVTSIRRAGRASGALPVAATGVTAGGV